MSRDYAAFDSRYIFPILNREKYLTVRYGWDEEELPYPGQTIDLVDSDTGEVFAEATVWWTCNLTIHQFAVRDFEGHRQYEDAEEMCRHMAQFYDADLTPETEVTVMRFDIND